jgi:hypothetical protein
MLGEILGGEAAGEPGSTEEDDVVVASDGRTVGRWWALALRACSLAVGYWLTAEPELDANLTLT